MCTILCWGLWEFSGVRIGGVGGFCPAVPRRAVPQGGGGDGGVIVCAKVHAPVVLAPSAVALSRVHLPSQRMSEAVFSFPVVHVSDATWVHPWGGRVSLYRKLYPWCYQIIHNYTMKHTTAWQVSMKVSVSHTHVPGIRKRRSA